ncbi:hypothetical protein T09_10609 [Trichinella sp. T9]|nr:hypothetical protein T09_10609 [Trichinella sp. T9]
MSNSKYTPHYRFISRVHGIVCSAHFLVLRAGDQDELCIASADAYEIEDQISMTERMYLVIEALQTELEENMEAEEMQSCLAGQSARIGNGKLPELRRPQFSAEVLDVALNFAKCDATAEETEVQKYYSHNTQLLATNGSRIATFGLSWAVIFYAIFVCSSTSINMDCSTREHGKRLTDVQPLESRLDPFACAPRQRMQHRHCSALIFQIGRFTDGLPSKPLQQCFIHVGFLTQVKPLCRSRGRAEKYVEMNAEPVETKKSSSNLTSAKLPAWSIPNFTGKVLDSPHFGNSSTLEYPTMLSLLM